MTQRVSETDGKNAITTEAKINKSNSHPACMLSFEKHAAKLALFFWSGNH